MIKNVTGTIQGQPSLSTDGTKLSVHVTYDDNYWGYGGTDVTPKVIGPLTLGLTEVLTNQAICTAIADAINAQFGTLPGGGSRSASDVLLFGGVSISLL